MKDIHVPNVNARYWSAITLASIFGTNTGDLFAHESGLGILGGLPVLAAVVVVAWFLERGDSTPHEAWYWLAIIAIRTGATNIADFLCGRRYLGIDRTALCVVLALLIAGLVWRASANLKAGLPRTDARYWTAMLAAGVFGTAGGDAVTGLFGSASGIGGVIASAVLALLLAAVLYLARRARGASLAWYWVVVCVARTTGTAVADMLAENRSFGIGLPLCTLWTGALFVGVLVLWPGRARAAAAT